MLAEYDTYRFKLPRFKHDDQLVISIDYIVNGDLEVLDPSKEDDPKVKECQETMTNGHFFKIVDYNFESNKIFKARLDHGQFKLECNLDKVMSKINRKLVIHNGEVECYSAYDLSYINPAFGRYSIKQYACDLMPDWLWARIKDGCFDGEKERKIVKEIMESDNEVN